MKLLRERENDQRIPMSSEVYREGSESSRREKKHHGVSFAAFGRVKVTHRLHTSKSLGLV